MSTTAPRRAASPARSPAASNLPFAKADIVLDAVPTPAEIDHALARLEMAAREHGIAVGYANALPATIARIAAWAKAVEEPRLRAGADHHGGGEGEVVVMSFRARARKTTDALLESLPYRPCAGMMVLNRAGLVFVGRRTSGPEHIDATHVWQMPQGGIDEDEDPYKAALRELYEETNIRSVEKLGEIADWLAYDIPRDIVGAAWGGKYRGQKQKWYALRFTGDDSEIDIANPAGGHEPEFIDWRWVDDERTARPGRAVQAADLRAGGEEFAKFAASSAVARWAGFRRQRFSASPCRSDAGRPVLK